MENVNPFVPASPNGLRAKISRELNELRAILVVIDSRLKNINHMQFTIPSHVPPEQLLNDFENSPDMFDMGNSKSDSESNDTSFISPFLDFDVESNDGEVINELIEYGGAGNFYYNKIINSIDGNDLAFPCMIEDIWEFIVSDIADVVMGRPFRAVSQLKYDRVKGLISITRIFDTYIFRMPRTIPRLKNFNWSIVFGEPPYPFNYPTRRLTMEEMLAKFIDEGRREHEEMEMFIKEFRTTNELLLKTRSNLLSELTIEEKSHDDGVENKSSSIRERTTQPLVKPQQSSVLFPNRLNELAELRDGVYENTRIYKEQTKKWHDSRLRGDKDFKVGYKVLLYNSRLKMYPGKLKSKWSGPNIVKTVYPHGAIEITDKDGFSFKELQKEIDELGKVSTSLEVLES
ncbi:hypothetical protein Tco_1491013 [Tanacetum coccineum]